MRAETYVKNMGPGLIVSPDLKRFVSFKHSRSQLLNQGCYLLLLEPLALCAGASLWHCTPQQRRWLCV